VYENAVADSSNPIYYEQIRKNGTFAPPIIASIGVGTIPTSFTLENLDELMNTFHGDTASDMRPYVVWPVDRESTKEIQAVLIGIGGVNTVTSVVDSLVMFWKIMLTQAQVAIVDAHPEVLYCRNKFCDQINLL
jgi:hypothetical protein